MAELNRSDLYPYQERATQHILDNSEAMMFLDVGLGKTITTLTAVAELLDGCQIYGALVLAPKLVTQTVWRQEALKWAHTQHLRVSTITGSAPERELALRKRADIYLLNYENLQWFAERIVKMYLHQGKPLPFDMVVFDESTKVKNARFRNGGSKRVRALCPLLPYTTRRVALTGTPAPNGLTDLFGQFLCLDLGKRFGTSFTAFRDNSFIANYGGTKYSPRKGAPEEIHKKISDITLEMSKVDYLDLPPVIEQDTVIPLTPKVRGLYDELEAEFFVSLDGVGDEIEAFNQAALAAKCLQVANGACYVEDNQAKWAKVHDLKLDALHSIVAESGGEPILLAYNFKHDAERIKATFPEAVHIKDGDPEEIIGRWNRGEIKMLLGHPRSMGHGLNLQFGGHHLVMFGLTWDLELYDQVIGRLDRPGQTKPVIVSRLITEDTIEGTVASALVYKSKTQKDLRSAIKAYRRAA